MKFPRDSARFKAHFSTRTSGPYRLRRLLVRVARRCGARTRVPRARAALPSFAVRRRSGSGRETLRGFLFAAAVFARLTVRNSIGIVSAVAISLAAMAGPIAHAPGNPFSDTFPQHMFGSAEPQSKQATKNPVGYQETKTTRTDPTAPTVISTAPPITPLPPGKECLTDCSVAADAGFERRIATLENNYEILINQKPPSLDAYASKTYVATAIKEHAGTESVVRDLAIQQAILDDVPRETKAITDALTAHAFATRAECGRRTTR